MFNDCSTQLPPPTPLFVFFYLSQCTKFVNWFNEVKKLLAQTFLLTSFPSHVSLFRLILWLRASAIMFFIQKCNVHGSVHRNNILVYKSQQDARATQFILSDNCSTSWYSVDHASQYNLFFISNLIHCFFVYVQYLLSSFLYMFQASQAHHQEV